MKVLVVDDCADSALLLSRLLESQGHIARSSSDGIAALELACWWRPDIVFLDLGLRGPGGYVLAQRLRRDVGLTSALLVVLSGYADDDVRRLGSGIDVHLNKPATAEQIGSIVPAWQHRQRSGLFGQEDDFNRDSLLHPAELAN